MDLVEKYLTKKPKKGDTVNHPRFGKGKVIKVDDTTYSVPFLIVQFGKDKIIRPQDEFLSEDRVDDLKANHNKIIVRDAKAMGLKYYPTWDKFVKGNWKIIDAKTKELQKDVSIIKDTKNREKRFKANMRDFHNELLSMWDALKGKE